MPALEVKGISRSFSNGKKVLDKISFSAKLGEKILIHGANGSGKTTLAKILAGILTPQEGSVIWSSHDLQFSRELVKSDISWIGPGEKGLFPRLTGKQNLELLSDFIGTPQKLREELFEYWRTVTPAENALRTPFYLCSTGMKQILKIMVLGLYSPKLIILDEPLKGLDAEIKEKLFHYLNLYYIEATIIVMSHMIDEVESSLKAKKLQLREGKLC